MRIRRRQLRVLQIALLLLALANTAFAQGDAWRCDTGEPCGSHASGVCCCPPERRPATCDTPADRPTGRPQPPPRSGALHALGPVAGVGTLGGGRGASAGCCSTTNANPSASSCCAGHAGGRTRQSGAALAATPHCRCVFAVSAPSEVALEPATVSVVAPELALPASDADLIPLASPVAFGCSRDENPASSLVSLSPLGSRAPPVC
jgi:hypothetical protein